MKPLTTPHLVLLTALAACPPCLGQSPLLATYLPHGPADPPNPAWSPTAYRDIPWWFEDTNPYWADRGLPNGAADVYDVSAVFAARLNRNNATGYEAAMINLPGAVGSYYGSPGGAFGTPSNSITWGNNVPWTFTMIYDWNDGNPQTTMSFANGSTIHTSSAPLGSRVIDFVNGTGPFLEPHTMGDVMMRFATIGTYGSNPGFTHSSVTVSGLKLKVNSGPEREIIHFADSVERSSITTAWDHIPGGTSQTNPRKVEFLLLNDVLEGHRSRVEFTGNLTFAWEGNANSISSSGLMFEMKLGDLDFFPDAQVYSQVPEPSVLISGIVGLASTMARRRRTRTTS